MLGRFPLARAPERKSAGAAGLDLYAAVDELVPSGQRRPVPTGVQVAIPRGWCGEIVARAGLAARECVGAVAGAGLIDSDYRGGLLVLLENRSAEPYQVRAGERIAQLLVKRCAMPAVRVVEALDETPRGTRGFGSTGN